MSNSLELEVELAQAAIDGAGIGICVVADDGRVIKINRCFAALFGIVRTEQIAGVLGAQYGVFSHRIADARVASRLFRADQLDTRSEHLVMGRDGSSRIVSFSARTVVVGVNDAMRVVSAQDVTDSRDTRDRLTLLQRQIEAMNGGVVITDATQSDNPIVYVNAGFLDMTGYSREEVIGRNCRFLQRDDRQQSGLRIVREAVAERRSFAVVLRNYRKDGSPFVNELCVSPVAGADGAVSHFIGFQRLVRQHEMAGVALS